MGKALILTTSLTYAQKGQRLLIQDRIVNDIVKTPTFLTAGSCGYSLRVDKNRLAQAVDRLLKARIMILGTYYRDEGERTR